MARKLQRVFLLQYHCTWKCHRMRYNLNFENISTFFLVLCFSDLKVSLIRSLTDSWRRDFEQFGQTTNSSEVKHFVNSKYFPCCCHDWSKLCEQFFLEICQRNWQDLYEWLLFSSTATQFNFGRLFEQICCGNEWILLFLETLIHGHSLSYLKLLALKNNFSDLFMSSKEWGVKYTSYTLCVYMSACVSACESKFVYECESKCEYMWLSVWKSACINVRVCVWM